MLRGTENRPKGLKGHVVVDMRALNQITISDAYPIPLQADVLSAAQGYCSILTVVCASFSCQFVVKQGHRYRLTVNGHQGQQFFNCALTGYRNSPAHTQRTIDRILRKYRSYARTYIDGRAIFSSTLEAHLSHLRAVSKN